MSTDDHYSEPDPSGDPIYEDPLLDWIGEKVVVEWAGREITGVVVDVDLAHQGHTFGELLHVEPDPDSATVAVEPDAVLASTRDL